MVEPIDAQNMLSRAPLVEKAAATQRDQAMQLNHPSSQVEKEKHHQNENVQFRPPVRQAEEREASPEQDLTKAEEEQPGPEEKKPAHVELVQEEAETPQHQVDMTI